MRSKTLLPLQQHSNFAGALQLLGQKARIIDLSDTAKVLTISRFGMLCTSRGPIWKPNTASDTKIAALRQSSLRLINADKDEAAIYLAAGFRRMHTPASVAELDLRGTATDRIARASGKWRNIWRRAQEAPLKITHHPFDPQTHQWLLDADLAQQRQKRYRALPHTVVQAYALRHPNDVVIYTAHHKRKPVAAMLFVLHHPAVTYHLGWSNQDGRRFAAHHRLLIEAATAFSQQGFHRLDLGTVDTDNAPGLARFKIGTGAIVRPLGGTWLKVPGL